MQIPSPWSIQIDEIAGDYPQYYISVLLKNVLSMFIMVLLNAKDTTRAKGQTIAQFSELYNQIDCKANQSKILADADDTYSGLTIIIDLNDLFVRWHDHAECIHRIACPQCGFAGPLTTVAESDSLFAPQPKDIPVAGDKTA
jgi:hypothetical protein